MKDGITEVVFILDKSGSMEGLEKDTIGGFNGMLKKQQDLEGEAFVTTLLFDNEYDVLHDHLPIHSINPLTEKDYYVGGSTALYDAIGRTIHKIKRIQEQTEEQQRAEKVIFVIITDGFENASREYSMWQINKMVSEEQEKGWEFIFLGANMDAIKEAGKIGILASNAAGFMCNSEGVQRNFMAVSDAIVGVREGEGIKKEWKAKIKSPHRS